MPAKYNYRGIQGAKYINGQIEAINRDEAAFLLKEQSIIISELVLASGQEDVDNPKGNDKQEQSTLSKKKVPFKSIIIFY